MLSAGIYPTGALRKEIMLKGKEVKITWRNWFFSGE